MLNVAGLICAKNHCGFDQRVAEVPRVIRITAKYEGVAIDCGAPNRPVGDGCIPSGLIWEASWTTPRLISKNNDVERGEISRRFSNPFTFGPNLRVRSASSNGLKNSIGWIVDKLFSESVKAARRAVEQGPLQRLGLNLPDHCDAKDDQHGQRGFAAQFVLTPRAGLGGGGTLIHLNELFGCFHFIYFFVVLICGQQSGAVLGEPWELE